MKRVLLVSMPFSGITSPSLGLSLLKAGLTRDGLPCDIRYLNLDFARRIDALRYERIANFMPDLLLGDWIFAAEVFGDRLPAAERYFAEVVHPTFAQMSGQEQDEASSADRDAEILEVRAAVGPYLDECLASVPRHLRVGSERAEQPLRLGPQARAPAGVEQQAHHAVHRHPARRRRSIHHLGHESPVGCRPQRLRPFRRPGTCVS